MDFNAMNLGIYVEVLYARIYNETIFFKTKPHFRNTLPQHTSATHLHHRLDIHVA